MPGGDGTGPGGMGPMTGRGQGYCAGYVAPGFANQMPGRGYGRGRGGGFGRGGGGGWGRRNWFHATGLTGWQRAAQGYPAWGGAAPQYNPVGPAQPYEAPTKEAELQALQSQAESLGDALEGIRKRIGELQAEGGSK